MKLLAKITLSAFLIGLLSTQITIADGNDSKTEVSAMEVGKPTPLPA